jgi:DNA-binding transcriptional LysR family regulator
LDYSFDLGLVGHEIGNRKLVVAEFFSDDLVVIVSRDHPWASRMRKITPTELSTEPFIATATGSGTRRVVEDRLRGFYSAFS